MRTTKWNFQAGEMPGLSPYMAGSDIYETSLEAAENVLIDVRGFLTPRPPICTRKWLVNQGDLGNMANGVVTGMYPYTYQGANGNVYGCIAFLSNGTYWYAIYVPCDMSAAVIVSTQQGGAFTPIGLLSDATNGNRILVKSGSAYSTVKCDGSTVTIATITFSGVQPLRGAIVYQGRMLALSGDKTIIGSEVGVFTNTTMPGTPLATSPFSVTLDMQGKINNIVATPRGILVMTTDSQWILVATNGILSPAVGVAAQKLTSYEIDSDTKMAGDNLYFMADDTINLYQYSNDLQAYLGAKILPTVKGNWLETFSANGRKYIICHDKSTTDYDASIVDMAGPRATTLRSAVPIVTYCAGRNGVFIASTNMIGFSLWKDFQAVPLDWYVSSGVVDVTGTGPFTITWNHDLSDASDLLVVYKDPQEGYKTVAHSYSSITKLITITKETITDINEERARGGLAALSSLTFYAGFGGASYQMHLKTHRLDGVSNGSYTIVKRKNITQIAVATNAATVRFAANGTPYIDEVQPEALSVSDVNLRMATTETSWQLSAVAEIQVQISENADRVPVIYGMEIDWDAENV
jgi:hypothetical protein